MGGQHNFGIKFNMEEEDSWELCKYSLGCLQFQTTNGFFVFLFLFLFLVFESFQQRSCTSWLRVSYKGTKGGIEPMVQVDL